MVIKTGERGEFYHVTGPVGWVKKDNINRNNMIGTLKNRCQFRIDPRDNSVKFGSLDNGTIVNIISEYSDYYQVNGGYQGWVYKTNINLLSAQAPPAQAAAAPAPAQAAPAQAAQPQPQQLNQGTQLIGVHHKNNDTFGLMNKDGTLIRYIYSGTNLSIINPTAVTVAGHPAIHVIIPAYWNATGYVYIRNIPGIKGSPGNYLGGGKSKRPKTKRYKSKRPKPKRYKSKRPKPKRYKSKRPKPKRYKSKRPKPKRYKSNNLKNTKRRNTKL